MKREDVSKRRGLKKILTTSGNGPLPANQGGRTVAETAVIAGCLPEQKVAVLSAHAADARSLRIEHLTTGPRHWANLVLSAEHRRTCDARFVRISDHGRRYLVLVGADEGHPLLSSFASAKAAKHVPCVDIGMLLVHLGLRQQEPSVRGEGCDISHPVVMDFLYDRLRWQASRCNGG